MRIVVAGAGIAGLAASIALARAGFDILVLEASPELAEVGAGIQLSPNASHILAHLDLLDEIRARAVVPDRIELRDGRSGRRLNKVPLGAVAEKRYGAPYLIIWRTALQSVLLAKARSIDRIEIRLGQAIHHALDDGDGVRVDTAEETVDGSVLVAADGVGSILRKAIFNAPGRTRSGRAAWRLQHPPSAEIGIFSDDATQLWLGQGAHFVAYPRDPVHGINLVFIAKDSGPGSAPPFHHIPALAGAIGGHQGWTHWPLTINDPTGPWFGKRTVLIGDAAHAMLPTAAQGGAQAIEDAWVLAACLNRWPREPALAFADYQRARRPRVARIHAQSQSNNSVFGLSGLSGMARNAAISALPAPMLLSRWDWVYGWRPEKWEPNTGISAPAKPIRAQPIAQTKVED